MLDELPRERVELSLVRLGHSARASDAIAAIGLDADDVEETLKFFDGELDTSPEQHLDYIFSTRSQSTQPPSRFTDGTIPVFYTAVERNTALAERMHWLSRVPASPYFFQILKVGFRGDLKNLGAIVPRPEWLTGNAEGGAYERCLSVSRAALIDGLEALLTPSARSPEGQCCPVLSRTAVVSLELEGYLRIEFDEGTGDFLSRYL